MIPLFAPRPGLALSPLGFGGASIGNLYSEVDDRVALNVVDTAWETGIRYFDTAPHYGLGLSERRLGAALRRRPRDEYLISTKVGRLLVPNPRPVGSDLPSGGFAVPDTLTRQRDYSRDGVMRSLEASLERLGLDRVDIVFVHDPEEHMKSALLEAIPALIELREQGVVGAIGAGMNMVTPLRRFVVETDVDVVMIAGRWTLLDRSAAPLLEDCVSQSVAVIAAGIFNSGLLSQIEPSDDAYFDYVPVPQDVLAAARACARVCAAHGTTLPAAALQFPLRHRAVNSIVVGMSSEQDCLQDVRSLHAPIDEALWDEMPDPYVGSSVCPR
jgi:D-threo-aldose 1-dehydrogenase